MCAIEGRGFSPALFVSGFRWTPVSSLYFLMPLSLLLAVSNTYAARGISRFTEPLPSGARPHSAEHCMLSCSHSFLSPHLSIWKLLDLRKVQWLLTVLSPTGAYPTQLFLSSFSKTKRWRQEWRRLNIYQGKEKWEQPGRGTASAANCWEAAFWGTGEGEIQ